MKFYLFLINVNLTKLIFNLVIEKLLSVLGLT